MAKRRFEIVFLDFYGTVSGGDREAVEATCGDICAACGLNGTTPAALALHWGERFFAEIGRSNHDDFQTLYECEMSSLQVTLDELGCRAEPAPLVRRLEEYWADPPIYEDARVFLERNDLPVCCVSNADTLPLQKAIERLGLRFDAVVTSEEARCYKPEPEIFRLALRKMNVPPEAAVHVGDSLHSDVSGAAAAGIATVWVSRDSRIHDIGNSQPDWKIGTLNELSGLLSSETP